MSLVAEASAKTGSGEPHVARVVHLVKALVGERSPFACPAARGLPIPPWPRSRVMAYTPPGAGCIV